MAPAAVMRQALFVPIQTVNYSLFYVREKKFIKNMKKVILGC